MASEPINVPIKTTYDDEGAKDALRDAEKIEDAEPELVVTADTDQAVADLRTVEEGGQRIDSMDVVADVFADIDQAQSDLRDFQDDLNRIDAEEVSPKVDTGGIKKLGTEADNSRSVLANMVGNSSQDLAGLGGVAGTVGTTLGQLGEYAAEGSVSLQGLASVAGPMAALTVVTIGMQKAAKDAAKASKELAEAIKDLSTESDQAALGSVTGMMAKQMFAGEELADVWDKIAESNIEGARRLLDLMQAQGQSEEATRALTEAIAEQDAAAAQAEATHAKYGDAVTTTGAALQTEGEALLEQQRNLDLTREATERAAKWEEEHASKLDDVAQAAQNAADHQKALNDALDPLAELLNIQRAAEDFATDMDAAMESAATKTGITRDEVRGLQDDVIEAARQTGANQIEVTQVLQKISAGDLAGAKAQVESWYANNPVTIQVQAELDRASYNQMISDLNRARRPGTTAAGTSVTTVNVNLPRGARHSDIARALQTTHRRSGRRYANPVVHYARR